MAGIASVAMLSMKQAASRPRPPLPSAASGSHLRNSAEPDAEIAERCLEHRQQAHIVQRIGEQAADQEFQARDNRPACGRRRSSLFRRQPAVHDAVAQRQRRRLVPVALGRHAGVLADRKPELGEDRALDLGQRQFVDRLAERRIVPWEFVLATLQSLQLETHTNDTRLAPRSKPPEPCCALRWYDFMQGPGRFGGLGAAGFGVYGSEAGGRAPAAEDRAAQGGGIAMRLIDRNRRRGAAGLLHQRHQRRFCRRQGRQERRRPELLLQRPATPRPPRAARRSSGNAAENSTPIIAATSCCRRCEADASVRSRGPRMARR